MQTVLFVERFASAHSSAARMASRANPLPCETTAITHPASGMPSMADHGCSAQQMLFV
jgi:hypothetical protein